MDPGMSLPPKPQDPWHHAWRVVGLSREIGARPRAVTLDGHGHVLWRDRSGTVAMLEDRCPHRGAPLSQGRVCDGAIACPYHGWQFDAAGRCTAMPALAHPAGDVRVPAMEVCEAGGFVLARAAGQAPSTIGLPMPPLSGGHVRLLRQDVVSTIADVAENALDTTHTSIVHAGYLRAADRMARVQPDVRTGPDWIEAHYPPQAAPSGFLGVIAGGQRYGICDRFRAPGIAEIEYSHNGRVVFAVAFHFTPSVPGTVAIHAAIHAPGHPGWGRPWAAIKTALARVALLKVFGEDTAMLKAVSLNRARFGQSRPLIMPQDLLRAGIDAILAGRVPRQPDHVPEILI
jgi:phenylpropionate dioxygenase-like ring-hydroxylating dioxygenase large terminal subunit